MTSLILSSRNHNLALPLTTIALTIIVSVSFSHYLLTPEEQSEVISHSYQGVLFDKEANNSIEKPTIVTFNEQRSLLALLTMLL